MIKNIVFDFGDVFINLDKTATRKAFEDLKISKLSDDEEYMLIQYELGNVSTEQFVTRFLKYQDSVSSEKELIDAWNAILKDFPTYRLDFIKKLNTSKKYRLFLLSNTNDLHISWIQKEWGIKKYREFKSCFEKFYLSHEICLRKPNANIYEFILNENHLRAHETLFIDDTKDHTDAAKKLGIHVWNIDPLVEDVVNLWTRKEFQQ